MLITALWLVLTSGLVHATWNLFAKTSINKVAFLWFCQWVAILIFLPFTTRELATMRHPIPFIGLALLLVSVFLHGGYVILLAQTYSLADLSQAYPIMRGTSPLLVPLAGVLILGEHLSVVAWMGVGLIVIGIFLVGGFRLRGVSRLSNRAVALAFAVGLMITGYTVFDKIVLQYIPPFALNEATNVGNLLALSAISMRLGSPMLEEWRRNWKTIILGGIMAPGGYILFDVRNHFDALVA